MHELWQNEWDFCRNSYTIYERSIIQNVRSRSTENKLSINSDQTKIIFHRPAARNLIIPPPLPGIERVKQATLYVELM